MTGHRHSRSRESGFAMLLVFLMAAVIAIALYNELPRVAFESQRAKEQLLIERGEQYRRAIQLFVRKMNRYPATIEELETTNNIRFLRKRYVDPITGKDKWRLIHVNGGVLTDSLVQKPKTDKDGKQPANTNTFIGEGPVLGATTDPNQQQINPALRRRVSDSRPVATQELPQQPQEQPEGADENGDNQNENEEGSVPEIPGAAGVAPGQQIPGMPTGNMPFPQGQMVPGVSPTGAYPGRPGMPQPYTPGGVYPGQTIPGQMPQGQMAPGQTAGSDGGFPQPTYPGQSSTGQTGTGVVFPGQQQGVFPGQQQGAFPGQQQGVYPGQPQSAVYPGQAMGQTGGAFGQATPQAGFGGGTTPGGVTPGNLGSMLGLTGPRPGGMQGLPGMGGTQMGGGIAGVASEAKDPSIIVYNERKKYNEWEFVYDQSKDRGLAGVMGNGGVPGTQASQMGNMPQSGFGSQPGNGNNSPFGGNSSFGGNSNSSFGGGSSFGQPSSGFGQSPPPQPPQQQQPQN